MGIESKINQALNKTPRLKRGIKKLYQYGMYAVSPKIKSEGNIIRVSPDDNQEYFFGYYDKSPWDASDRYMLCMQAKDTWSDVSPKQPARILLIDTLDNNKTSVIATTHTWNVQQGCMLQWLGPDFKSRIIYNDFRDGKYVSVILTLSTKEEKIIPFPVYSVAADGSFALSLDFSRLYRLRPGYGYYNCPEETVNEKLPDKPCIWKIDLKTGDVQAILKYTDLANFEPRPEMNGAEHKVNHIMLSPNGQRFMVLHRWFQGQRKYSRLVTCNSDGSDMYNLSDDDMVSHCCWKNDREILAFENKKGRGPGYYLMKDKSHKYKQLWKGIDFDGHPSYSPDGEKIVFDRYPDRSRVASVMISDSDNCDKNKIKTLAKVFAPFKYDNDTRCDLHPRWSRNGEKICFDAVFEGHRGLYTVEVESNNSLQNDKKSFVIDSSKKISVIVPVYNVEQYVERCVKSILAQTYQNIEIILVDDGSTDKSGIICDEISLEHKNVKVIHKPNGGPSSARNAGLKFASGDYLAFVDSDDWIAKDIYNACIKISQQYNADIVDYLPVFTDGRSVSNTNERKNPRIVEGENILYDYMLLGQTKKSPFSVWRKLYKKSLFDDIEFPEGRINEDIVTNFLALKKAKKLVHIYKVGYYYFQNSESTTRSKLRRQDFDLIFASRELCRLSKNLKDKRIFKLAKVKLGRSYFSLLAKAALDGFADDIDNKKLCIKVLTRNLRKNYRLLMSAPISKNRKIMITLVCINFNLLAFPARVYKMIGDLRNRKI